MYYLCSENKGADQLQSLICIFVFAYAKSRFSFDAAHLILQCVDANQKWGVQESIDWMKALAPYKPLWIEEPTSPDDVLGHAAIAKVMPWSVISLTLHQLMALI